MNMWQVMAQLVLYPLSGSQQQQQCHADCNFHTRRDTAWRHSM